MLERGGNKRNRMTGSSPRRKSVMGVLLASAWLVLVLGTSTTSASFSTSRITVEPDGGYKGIVIKVKEEVPEEECADILANLKVGTLFSLFFRPVFFRGVISGLSESGKGPVPKFRDDLFFYDDVFSLSISLAFRLWKNFHFVRRFFPMMPNLD